MRFFPIIVFLAIVAISNVANAADFHSPDAFVAEDEKFVLPEKFRDKLTLVNFWATWCEPCKRELPELAELEQKYRRKGFRVVAISMDVDRPGRPAKKLVKDFLKARDISELDVVLAEKTNLMRIADINGLPTTILFNENGVEIRREEGYYDWSGEIVERIRN